jgi:hypothetical protein
VDPETYEANAVLTVWTNAKAEAEADFNEWYNRQHVNERCDVPGFLSGRRYKSILGGPRYMALYDTAGSDILSSEPYRRALDTPTSWTQRIMPSFYDMTRSVLDIEARVGRGYGSIAASFRPTPGKTASDMLERWLKETALPSALAQPGITNAQFLKSKQPSPATQSTEGRLRTEPDASIDWAVFVEGTEPHFVRAACRSILSRAQFREHGAGTVHRGLYRLLYGNDALRKDF